MVRAMSVSMSAVGRRARLPTALALPRVWFSDLMSSEEGHMSLVIIFKSTPD